MYVCRGVCVGVWGVGVCMYVGVCVCMYVWKYVGVYGYAFPRALTYGVETWHGVGPGMAHEVWEHIFETTQLKDKGHPEVKLL